MNVAAQRMSSQARKRDSRRGGRARKKEMLRHNDEGRLSPAVEITDKGAGFTAHHHTSLLLLTCPRNLLLILPLGISIAVAAIICFLTPASFGSGLWRALFEVLPAQLVGGLLSVLSACVLYFGWWRPVSPIRLRVTSKGNVGVFRRGRAIAVEEAHVRIVRFARVWGKIRWAGKCTLVAWGPSVKKDGRSFYGKTLFNRRVYGVTKSDIIALQGFCERHGVTFSVDDFSSGGYPNTYEDRGLWA